MEALKSLLFPTFTSAKNRSFLLSLAAGLRRRRYLSQQTQEKWGGRGGANCPTRLKNAYILLILFMSHICIRFVGPRKFNFTILWCRFS